MKQITNIKELSDVRFDLKTRLEKEHDMKNHPKADALFRVAWKHGWGKHASLKEVENCYIDFADLV